MNRFYFQVRDGTPDASDVSADFANEEAAILAAIQLAGELLLEAPQRFRQTHPWQVRVVDESREERFAIALGSDQDG